MLVQAVLGGPGSKSGHTLSGFYRKVSVKIEFMLSRTMRLCGRDAGSLRHTHHGRGCISQLVNTDYREYDAHCSDSDFMEFDGLQRPGHGAACSCQLIKTTHLALKHREPSFLVHAITKHLLCSLQVCFPELGDWTPLDFFCNS